MDRKHSVEQNQKADATKHLAGKHDDEVVARTTPQEIFEKRCAPKPVKKIVKPKASVLKAGKKYKNGPARVCDGAADKKDASAALENSVKVGLVY